VTISGVGLESSSGELDTVSAAALLSFTGLILAHHTAMEDWSITLNNVIYIQDLLLNSVSPGALNAKSSKYRYMTAPVHHKQSDKKRTLLYCDRW
jgi:hypothetical protein